MTNGNRFTLFAGVAVAGLLGATAAEAGGFAIREQSAVGQGSSFAGVAAGGSLSSMFWNPATLSDIERMEIEKAATVVLPFVDVDFSSTGPSGDDEIGIPALVPSGYFAKRVSDRIVLGVGLNGPFGLATAYDDDSPLRTFGIAGTSKVFSLNLNPAVSYQVTDWLSVAAGLQLQYIHLKYTQLGLPTFGVSDIVGDDVAAGFTAGLRLTPFPGTEVGLGYRSFINHEIDGDFQSGALATTFDATARDFDLPDIATIGLRQSITERVRVMAGAEWSNWSRFDVVPLDTAGATIPLGFNYDDGWFFSIGGEFDLRPNLTLRGGVGYELSPIDDDTRSFRLPDSDRLWLSAGGSYALNERWSFDAGYSLIMAKEADILSAAAGGPPGNQGFSGEGDTNIHIVSLGVTRKFGGAPHSPSE